MLDVTLQQLVWTTLILWAVEFSIDRYLDIKQKIDFTKRKCNFDNEYLNIFNLLNTFPDNEMNTITGEVLKNRIGKYFAMMPTDNIYHPGLSIYWEYARSLMIIYNKKIEKNNL